jgi:hypothetical protein
MNEIVLGTCEVCRVMVPEEKLEKLTIYDETLEVCKECEATLTIAKEHGLRWARR